MPLIVTGESRPSERIRDVPLADDSGSRYDRLWPKAEWQLSGDKKRKRTFDSHENRTGEVRLIAGVREARSRRVVPLADSSGTSIGSPHTYFSVTPPSTTSSRPVT